MGGFLSTILRMLAPIAVEHGGQVIRDRLKANAAAKEPPQLIDVDRIQQVADDVTVLRGALAEIKSEHDLVIGHLEIRADRQRRWIIALVVWNAVITIALITAILLLRKH